MKIGIVPYTNCLPLTKYLPSTVQIFKKTPAELSEALLNDELDVALLPLYTIIKYKLRMHPDAGIIGCDGAVKSVGFYTRNYIESLDQIHSLYLDKESLSSIYLAKIILKKFYGISLYDLEFFHEDNREMADAQVLIGDKAMTFVKQSKVPYKFWDMGKIWKEHTGTGIMFACWASKKALSPAEVDILQKAKQLGLLHIQDIINDFGPEQRDEMRAYLTQNIKYEVNNNIKNGLKIYKQGLDEYSYSDPRPKQVA